MNNPVTALHKHLAQDGSTNRMFRAYFKPDPEQENFCVGMAFHIVSVNRQTGEIQFSLDMRHEHLPREDELVAQAGIEPFHYRAK